jgi:small conductance mechanosensitive channel
MFKRPPTRHLLVAVEKAHRTAKLASGVFRFPYLWSIALATLVVLLLGIPTLAQFPNFSPPALSGSQPPVGVERRGLIEATGVRLDGRELFKIASPTVYDRSKPSNQIPVEMRARQIEANLEQVVNQTVPQDAALPGREATPLDPQSLQTVVEIINNQPVLLAKDDYLAQPRVLLTVIDSDAQYYSTTKEDLAKQWQGILQDALRKSLEIRQPGAFKHQVTIALSVLAGTVILSLIAAGLWRWLGRRQHHLEQLQNAQETATTLPPATTDNGELDGYEGIRLFEGFRQELTLQRRIRIVKFLRWLFFWGTILLWITSAAVIMYRFPQTRSFAVRLLPTPFLLLIAWFLMGLANRLVILGIDRFAKAWEEQELVSVERLQRRSLRLSTIRNTVKGLATALIYSIGIIWVLQALNIATGSVLAFGAFLALAASFAAQNLVKDLANGFLILLEDQYAIGDFIKVNQVSGLVENLNLRITQIRNDAGHLITIPNSQITQVENMTRTWSRIDFQVEVAYSTDVDKAIAIVRDVAQELAQDPNWKSFILNPEELLGVEKISHSGVLLRIWIRTVPSKQWVLAREFRRRLKIAFDRHNIEIGIPQQSVTGSFWEQADRN